MGFKSLLIRPYARHIARSIRAWSASAVDDQRQLMHKLIASGQNTALGRDHDLKKVKQYADFKKHIPIRDYEALRAYFERVSEGEGDVLWPGKPRYLAKTSGTTSGTKYIPITKDSLPSHFGTARNAVLNYAAKQANYDFFDGKIMFLSGSPVLGEQGGILTGRLSGISNHLIPAWLKGNQLPSYETNCIEDWEQKVEAVVTETADADMRLISGIPPWVQMYFERLLARTNAESVQALFPHFSLFVYGGVNYEPYRDTLEALIGFPIDSLETYPASEGFVAFQDCFPSEGLLLNTRAGMFFEFVEAQSVFDENPERISLADVELGVNYALIINSNAGLWGYNIGDTVKFVSKAPYRIIVSGRIKHFISAFGEHVIGEEVERAMLKTTAGTTAQVIEFTVAPQVNPESGLPYHEWFVEFEKPPEDISAFAQQLDQQMQQQNSYYLDLVQGAVLRPLVLRALPKGSFREVMKKRGKLGGQNKVPRLSNDRALVELFSL